MVRRDRVSRLIFARGSPIQAAIHGSARVLITATGLKSNLVTSIALAERLREAGFEIAFAAPKDAHVDIAAAGFPTHEIQAPRLGAMTGYFDPDGTPAPDRAARAAEIIRGEGFGDVLHAMRPDLVLADCEHHGAILQTLGANISIGLLSFMYFTPPSPKSPPLNSAILPGAGLKGSGLGIRAAWTALRAKKRLALARARMRHKGADFASAHHALADEMGLDMARLTTDAAFQLPWSVRLPTLHLVPEGLDFPTKLRPGDAYGGPIVSPTRLSADRTAFAHGTGDTTRRIYASFGSIRTAPDAFLDALITVATNNPNWAFLIGAKNADDIMAKGPPANLRAVPWADQMDALQDADCAIFHGGAGTLNECVLSATPMLIYPNALDGAGNAARVLYHKVGQVGAYDNPAQIIEADLTELMGNPSYRDRLSAMAAAPGPERATDFVTALITTTSEPL